ncbi:MAG: 50S ribosomal protein L17 [Mariniphaga sp.]|nr:50S ribosomal protein L17 [Mariniphaga sp.]
MRHNKKFNHLSRKTAHRKAMLANMASSLIQHKRITTTVAKAKALRMFVEPLITKAKDDTTHSRRVVFSYLKDKEAVTELFREISGKIADRPGGYTRILKTGNRLGDNADMCIIELVDYNETLITAQEEDQKPKKRRSRRGGSGAKKSDTVVAEVAEEVAETSVEEVAEVVETEPEAVAEEVQVETEVVEEVAESAEEVKAEVETSEEEVSKEEEPKAEVKKEESKKEKGSEDKKDK